MEAQLSHSLRKILLVLSSIFLAVGCCGGPMIIRCYFIQGGNRQWLSTWLLTAAWPLNLIPLAISYIYRRKTEGSKTSVILMKTRAFLSAAMTGVFLGLANYLSTFGLSRLPVSTGALILSTSTVFTAFFAVFLVRQKFTPYSINSIVLLTVGAAVLALRADSDRPAGENKKSYVLGFVVMVSASALGGILMPFVEMAYKKANQRITCSFVLEFQVVMCLSGTIFATVGMLVNNDFKAIPREAREFKAGEPEYYLVLVFCAIIWQFYNLGFVGVIFCSSALMSGIYIAVLLPVTQLLAVIFFHDKFSGEKGVSLVLCLWGFVSYFYGAAKDSKKNQIQESEATPTNKNQDEESGITPNPAP